MVFIMKTTSPHSQNRLQLRLGSVFRVFGRRLALPLFFLSAALLMQPCAAQMGVYRQPSYSQVLSHGDVALRWNGAGHRRCNKWSGDFSRSRNPERGSLRSSHGNLDGQRQPHWSTVAAHGDVATRRQPGSRRRLARPLLDLYLGTVRSGHANLDLHRQPSYWSAEPHDDVAGQRHGAGSWRDE